MIDKREVLLIEFRREVRRAHRHSYAVAESLTQWAGGDFDAGRQNIFRMARSFRSPLAKVFDVVQRKIISGEIKQRVKQHAAVPRGEQEAITVFPLRIPWVIAHELCPQYISHRRCAQGQAGMPRLGLLYRVNRQCADSVDAKLI